MRFSRGTLAVTAVCVAFAVGLLSGAGFAAKSKAKAWVSPSAAKLAAKLGVDLSTVTPQGPSIEIADVEAHVRSIMLQWLDARCNS